MVLLLLFLAVQCTGRTQGHPGQAPHQHTVAYSQQDITLVQEAAVPGASATAPLEYQLQQPVVWEVCIQLRVLERHLLVALLLQVR